MRTSTLFLSLFPVMAAGLLAVTGCLALGEGAVRRAGPLSISRTSFRGWEDAYLITNGDVEVVVVPQIARIMKYATAGGENLLWVNDELTPEVTGQQTAPPDSTEWINYGGYKLWPAPQKDWGWPPDWQLDRGPCRVEVAEAGTLRLIGAPSPQYGLRFDREITLALEGSRLEVVQTAVNVSDEPITASIWDVTQVKADCVGFVPLGPGAEYRTGEGQPLDEQWSRSGDMLLVKPTGKTGKVFISGPPGWFGCRRGELIYLKLFDIAEDPPPEPETSREVYTGDMGYTELEVVGPAVSLQPGESTTLKETWYLLPAGPKADTDAGLIETVTVQVGSLTGR